MSNDPNVPRERSGTRRKTHNQYEVAEARTALVKNMVATENAALVAKTAKLRALRLAKEEADRAEALANPAPPAAVKLKRRR